MAEASRTQDVLKSILNIGRQPGRNSSLRGAQAGHMRRESTRLVMNQTEDVMVETSNETKEKAEIQEVRPRPDRHDDQPNMMICKQQQQASDADTTFERQNLDQCHGKGTSTCRVDNNADDEISEEIWGSNGKYQRQFWSDRNQTNLPNEAGTTLLSNPMLHKNFVTEKSTHATLSFVTTDSVCLANESHGGNETLPRIVASNNVPPAPAVAQQRINGRTHKIANGITVNGEERELSFLAKSCHDRNNCTLNASNNNLGGQDCDSVDLPGEGGTKNENEKDRGEGAVIKDLATQDIDGVPSFANTCDVSALRERLRRNDCCEVCANHSIVWLYIKGNPWWPAQRVDVNSDYYREKSAEYSSKNKSNNVTKTLYQFFGGGMYYWINDVVISKSVLSWSQGMEKKLDTKKTKSFLQAMREVMTVVESARVSLTVTWPMPWWNNPFVPDQESEDVTISDEGDEGDQCCEVEKRGEKYRRSSNKKKRKSACDTDDTNTSKKRMTIWPVGPPNLSALIDKRFAENRFTLPPWIRQHAIPPSYKKVQTNVYFTTNGSNTSKKRFSKDDIPVCSCIRCENVGPTSSEELKCGPERASYVWNSHTASTIRGRRKQNVDYSRGSSKLMNSSMHGDRTDQTEDDDDVQLHNRVLLLQQVNSEQNRSCGASCLNRRTRLVCDQSLCPAGSSCGNLPFHKLRSPRVKVVLTKRCGWGVIAMEPILPGQFIVEYAGEVIDDEECEKRLEEAREKSEANFYMMQIQRDQVIDARDKGNFSRFINSSCNPNCQTQMWTYAKNGEIHVGIFAIKAISQGTELSYDYKFEHFGLAASSSFRCQCGSEGCRGTLDAQPERLRNHMRKCEVLWDDGKYYSGTVLSYNALTKNYKIRYDDGDMEEINLCTVRHRWLKDDPLNGAFKSNYVNEIFNGDSDCVADTKNKRKSKSQGKVKKKKLSSVVKHEL